MTRTEAITKLRDFCGRLAIDGTYPDGIIDGMNEAIETLASPRLQVQRMSDLDLIDQRRYYIQVQGSWLEAEFDFSESKFFMDRDTPYEQDFTCGMVSHGILISKLDNFLNKSIQEAV